MGRLNTMTDNIATQTIVTAATYGPANETLSIAGGTYFGAWAGETRTYNSLKQLTALASGTLSINYTFPSTYINGKISSQTDTARINSIEDVRATSGVCILLTNSNTPRDISPESRTLLEQVRLTASPTQASRWKIRLPAVPSDTRQCVADLLNVGRSTLYRALAS